MHVRFRCYIYLCSFIYLVLRKVKADGVGSYRVQNYDRNPGCQTGPKPDSFADTYHAWTLIGTHNYYMYSGDFEWLQTIWHNYTFAVSFLESKVDSSGLMNVTGLRDWARIGGGGHNSEGNALLYKVPSPL
jgi:hypothetical protein